MATLTLTINFPDADAPDVLAALRLQFATLAIPNPTQAQLRTALENELRQRLVRITTEYRRTSAAIPSPVVT